MSEKVSCTANETAHETVQRNGAGAARAETAKQNGVNFSFKPARINKLHHSNSKMNCTAHQRKLWDTQKAAKKSDAAPTGLAAQIQNAKHL